MPEHSYSEATKARIREQMDKGAAASERPKYLHYFLAGARRMDGLCEFVVARRLPPYTECGGVEEDHPHRG